MADAKMSTGAKWMLGIGITALVGLGAVVVYEKMKHKALPTAPQPAGLGTTTHEVSPGADSVSAAKGNTLVIDLPNSATWASTDPVLADPSLGGTVGAASQDPSTGTNFVAITQVSGAGSIQLNWLDASGNPQQTTLAVSTQ